MSQRYLWQTCMVFVIAMTGCTLDAILPLSESCPNIAYVQLPSKLQCHANTLTEECKSYHENGVFEQQRCPLSYHCVETEEENYCACSVPCGVSCCPENTFCDEHTSQCLPTPEAGCQNDDQCATLDLALPYCDLETGKCVACLEDEQCDDDRLFCSHQTCIECDDSHPCDDPLICNAQGRCVACLGTEPPRCQNEQTLEICSQQGEWLPVNCPDETPICKDAACIECQTHSDCTRNGYPGYCIDQRCFECMSDTECADRSKNNIATPFCLDNQCASCKSDDNCKDPNEPACNTTLGRCAQCSATTPGDRCEGKDFITCDHTTGVDRRETCNNICSPTEGCVDCNTHEDCALPNKYCTESKQCIQCYNNDDCDTGVCNTETNTCVECIKNEHCTTGGTNTCVDHACVSLCKTDSDCPEGYICPDNTCRLPPTDGNCYNDSHCTGNKSVCNKTAGVCVECTKDDQCISNGRGNVCDANTYECRECSNDNHCSGSTPKCNLDTKTCVACYNDAPRCTTANTLETCTNNQWVSSSCGETGCTNGRCNRCKSGAVECNGTKLEKCIDDQWSLIQTCPVACQEGRCLDCTPNTKRCDGKTLVTCSSTGNETRTNCSGECYNEQCVECIPGTSPYCSGNDLIQCNSNGKQTSKYCSYGCSGNSCNAYVCSTGQTRCSGSTTQQTCNNNAWGTNITCTYGCNSSNGSCNKPKYVQIIPRGSSNGPDIDAIVVVRNGNNYSSNCKNYGTCITAKSASGSIDSSYGGLYTTYGMPDAYISYPSNNICYYRSASDNTTLTFATLTGSTVFTLEDTINSGDTLYVFELSNCTLRNAGTSTGNQALTDNFDIYISTDKSNWKYLTNSAVGGVVTHTITY